MRRFCLLLPLALGCSEAPPELPPEAKDEPSAIAGSRFDASTASTIRGSVQWNGRVPTVPSLGVRATPTGAGPRVPVRRDNPNAPLVDLPSRGVGNAMVFLRGVDPAVGRPWDHAPVALSQAEYRLCIRQGDCVVNHGIVRRGDTIHMISRQAVFHSLHADGASYFTLAFPDPDQPRTRRMSDVGVVELSSVAGYFWMRGYLFVDDHPYYCRTDACGRFVLADVPPGQYQLVCWMPNWVEASRSPDPDNGLTIRLDLQPPVEVTQTVTIEPGTVRDVHFTVTSALFQTKAVASP